MQGEILTAVLLYYNNMYVYIYVSNTKPVKYDSNKVLEIIYMGYCK